MADGGEVDADLVRASGLQPARQQRQSPAPTGGARRPRTRCAPGARRRRPPSASGRRDRGRSARRRCRAPASGWPHDERDVAPARRMGGELGDQRRAAPRLGAGHDEQPGAAGVEAVDDARAVRCCPDAGEVREAGEQAVDEGAVAALPAPGWTTRPAGLSTTTTSSSTWTTPNSTDGSARGGARDRDRRRVDRHVGTGGQAGLAGRRRPRRRRAPHRRR